MKGNKMSSLGERYLKQKKQRQNWKKLVTVLCLVVVIATMYVLVLPAIALNHPLCGLEEHEHGEQCYVTEKVLICDERIDVTENIEDIENIGNAEDAENMDMKSFDVENVGIEDTTTETTTKEEATLENADSENINLENANPQNADSKSAISEEAASENETLQQLDDVEGEKKHQHTEECFKEEQKLVCQIPEHRHDESCTENEQAIVNNEGSDEIAIEEVVLDEKTSENVKLDETESEKAKEDGVKSEEKSGEEKTDDEKSDEEKADANETAQEDGLVKAVAEEEGDDQIAADAAATALDRSINQGIKMHVFNYGSKIDRGRDGELDFFENSYSSQVVDYERNSHGGSTAPKLNKTLNGYPKGTVTYNNTTRNIDLTYLFSPDTNTYDDYTWEQYYANKSGYRGSTNPTTYRRITGQLNNDGGLFKKDSDGFLLYDSMENAAAYDYINQKFDLYDHTVRPRYTSRRESDEACGNFLPFNDPTNVSSQDVKQFANGKTNYKLNENTELWFGMTMEMDFFMPKGGQINGRDKIFEFSGDDDVWVYVDDVLVLDIGGCHAAEHASIDFATGEVENPNNGGSVGGDNLKSIFRSAGKDVSTGFNGNTFSDYTKHNLKFFYLERGGNISYCKLHFNMNPLPEGSLSVKKELSYDETITEAEKEYISNNYSYKFQYVDSNGEQLENFAGRVFNVLDKNNNPSGKTVTIDSDGCFTIRAGESVVIDDIIQYMEEGGIRDSVIRELIPVDEVNQYGSVQINGREIPRDEIITLSDGKQYYVFPYAVNFEEGTNSANFINDNNIATARYMGYLEISKEVVDTDKQWDEDFFFHIELDGKAVRDGTSFTVFDADGNELSEKIYAQNGVISLKAGQTARMDSRLLEGTRFKIVEQNLGENWSISKYEVTKDDAAPEYYDAEQGAQIVANSTKRVTVYNTHTAFGVDVPISKQFVGLVEGDSEKRAATFSILKMLDQETLDPNAVQETLVLECLGDKVQTGSFYAGYDASNRDGLYYYQIRELEWQNLDGEKILHDNSTYVVEIEVKTDNNGKRSATVSKLYKDGQEVTKQTEDEVLTAAFVNHRATYILPTTGGIGRFPYIFSGAAMILLALAFIYIKNGKKWREES